MAKKLILDIDEDTWKRVLKFKIDKGYPNNNEAVVKLIKWGLASAHKMQDSAESMQPALELH